MAMITTDAHGGVQSFYLNHGGNQYYMFSQEYRHGVFGFFMNGITLDRALDRKAANYDRALIRTMDKIIPSIRYLEKEYNIRILKKSKCH